MQNLTAREKNLTHLECYLCLNSPVIATLLPYALISLPMNGWVLWLMASSPGFWTDRMEVSEFHLVLTEILLGVLGSPLMSITLVSSSYNVADQLFKLVSLIVRARNQFQSSICIERYVAVVHPLMYLRYKPLRYRMSFCCFIWLENIVMGTFQIFFCIGNPFVMGMYGITFLCVFIIITFCCLTVLRALKQPSPGDGEREGSNLMKKRAFNIVLIFQASAFVSYVPPLAAFLVIDKLDQNILCIWSLFSYSVMIWLGVIYPFLYLRRAGKHKVIHYLCVKCFQE